MSEPNASWGADEPQGPGWYQASDGKWYPPQGEAATPATAPAASPAAAAPPGGGASTTSGVTFTFDHPLEVSRWMPLYTWLTAIPHFFVLLVFGIAAYVMVIVAFFSVLFTKKVPEGVHEFLTKFYRYAEDVFTYVLFMRSDYPKFGLRGGSMDPNDGPVHLSIEYSPELNRWAPLYKWLLAIPHFIVLYVLGIGVSVCWLIAWFAVLFTGKWPEGLRNFVIGVTRWSLRVSAYANLFLRDEYPPFALD